MKAIFSTTSTSSVLSRPPEPRAAEPSRWEARLGGIRLLFGAGRLAELGTVAAEHGRRALVISDPGLYRAGHVDRAVASLDASGVVPAVFDGVDENPTTDHVEAGVEAARDHGCDLLVALGGGSAMDCAKGINFVLTNGGSMADYQGWGKALRPMLPALGVPTTAGTGSDAQSYALISHPDDHRKMACGDPKARFAAVILDPELLASAPRRVLATAGVDAVSHAVESYVCTARNPVSSLHAREAFRLLMPALPALLADPANPAAAGAVLWGAHLAGAAIEQSMLGIAHSCANPLTARLGVAHGAAVGRMLPTVVRFNGAVAASLYAELLAAVGAEPEPEPAASAASHLAARLEALLEVAGLAQPLRSWGIGHDLLPRLGAEAAEQWTARFNPRPVTAENLVALYEEVW